MFNLYEKTQNLAVHFKQAYYLTKFQNILIEGSANASQPQGFHKLCRPYVLIAIQHSLVQSERGIFSQPTLLIFTHLLCLIFYTTFSLSIYYFSRCGMGQFSPAQPSTQITITTHITLIAPLYSTSRLVHSLPHRSSILLNTG